MRNLKRFFLAGLAALLPLSFTVFVLWFVVTRLGNVFGGLLARYQPLLRLPGWVATIAGFVLMVLFVIAIGALASGIIGRWLLGWLDRLLRQVPFVKEIYGSARQFADAVFVERSALRRTVIAEYPSQGLFAIGFLTSDERLVLADGRKALFVFFPTAPNPTSGWLALIPEEELAETSLSIDAGLKLVVSGGVIRPAELPSIRTRAGTRSYDRGVR